MIYLYHKIGSRLDVFDFVFLGPGAGIETTAVSENMHSWRVLDQVIQDSTSGNVLAVESLGVFGKDACDMSVRVKSVLGRRMLVWIGAFPASYSCGMDFNANAMVLSGILYGMDACAGASFLRVPAGRPEVQYPDGWDEMYADWKAGKLSPKEFLMRSGLKKATFYNRLADYAPVYVSNQAYRDVWHIA